MRQRQQEPDDRRHPESGPPTGEYESFATEDAQDRRSRRYALVAAVLVHVALLALRFPVLQAQPDRPPARPVHIIQPIRFEPPPPERQQEIPRHAEKRVPIPDPTPDDPEPIRLETEIEEAIILPSEGVVFDIPDAPPPSEPTGPIYVGWESPPIKIHAPPPHYTEVARRARIQGVVIVQAIIDEQGIVTSVKLLKGLPMGLDQAALDAIKQWRFEPARLTDGRPVAVYYTLTVNFELQ